MKLAPLAGVILTTLLGSATQPAHAAVPLESWLPPNTFAVLGVPNFAQTREQIASHPFRLLLFDPAMAPFREHLLTELRREWGSTNTPDASIRLLHVLSLLQGPGLVALSLPENYASPVSSLRFVALADLGSQVTEAQSALSQNSEAEANATPGVSCILEGVKFVDSGLAWPPPMLSVGSTEAPPPGRACWWGLLGSWLIVGSDTNELVTVLERMKSGGGDQPKRVRILGHGLEESPADTVAYAWLNLAPLVGWMLERADAFDRQPLAPDAVPMPKRRTMLEAAGLSDLEECSLLIRESPAGTSLGFEVAAHSGGRRGLLKMIELQPREASPPPDVPSKVLWFERIRLDFNQSWTAFQGLVTGLFPQAESALNLLFQSTGPGGVVTDLRRQLLDALGDDVVRCGFLPQGHRLRDLATAPSYTRLASSNAVQLALSLKAVSVLLPPPLSDLRQENFMGRELYTLPLRSPSTSTNAMPRLESLTFTTFTNSVVFATDSQLLRSMLLAKEASGAELRQLSGLEGAAREVGGTNQGLFGYFDLAAAAQWAFATLPQETNAWRQLLALTMFAPPPDARIARLERCTDFRLLPPFEAVARYFSYTVHAAGADDRHLFYRLFMPRPAALATGNTSTGP